MSRRQSSANRSDSPSRPTRILGDDPSPTCLSDIPHGPAATRDLLRHYFGCIEMHQRDGFLDRDNAFWREQTAIELSEMVAVAKEDAEGRDMLKMQSDAEDRVDKAIAELAISIEAHHRKTDMLRRALSKKTAQGPSSRSPASDGSLVLYIDQSRKAWRASRQYRQGIGKVRSWRKLNGLRTDPEGSVDMIETEPEYGRRSVCDIIKRYRPDYVLEPPSDYDVEKDAKAYLIQYTFQPHPSADHRSTQGESHLLRNPTALQNWAQPVEEEIQDARFQGRFPHQHVSVDLLLRSDSEKSRQHGFSNILSKKLCDQKDPTRLRYIHLPFNNMEWVENVIANYYDDPAPSLSNTRSDIRTRVQTQTQRLLRPELWRGQQNGAHSEAAHARHMRLLCERSSSAETPSKTSENVVLFMPYMDLETNRTKEIVSKAVDAESERHRERLRAFALEKRQAQIQRRRELGGNGKRITHGSPRPKGVTSIPARVFITKILKSVTEDGRPLVASVLGQYLIDAARLYEGMSTFQDQQMIEKYLCRVPPLHPRRTLDQFRHRGLKMTRARDQSQVVYRGTSDIPWFRHRFVRLWETTGLGQTRSMQESVTIPTERNSPEHQGGNDEETTIGSSRESCQPSQVEHEHRWEWTGHDSETDEKGCEHCASDIKRTPKLIMVDQLWMWVLDEKTVITAFPGRYGDGYGRYLDGIHRSIRSRLGKEQIWSAFDVALIILDECSTTFFGRTGIDTSQSRVLDIFWESIGRVTNRSTYSLDHLLHWGREVSRILRSKYESAEHYMPLFSTNEEGGLLQEVKDIVEEADIMLSILKRQREIIGVFGKHVERILDPEERRAVDPESVRLSGDSARHGSEAVRTKHETARRSQLVRFRVRFQDLVNKVSYRVGELEDLREDARSTAQDVFDLITLKQQQGAVFQMRSLTTAEETARQGRVVVMFTVVTIIFLPLSFIASVFGMNNSTFGGDDWSLEDQFRLMFPISLSIVFVSVVFAFYDFLRTLVWSINTYLITLLTTKSGFYRVWLGVKDDLGSASLQAKTEKQVSRLKDDVRQARKRRILEIEARRWGDWSMAKKTGT